MLGKTDCGVVQPSLYRGEGGALVTLLFGCMTSVTKSSETTFTLLAREARREDECNGLEDDVGIAERSRTPHDSPRRAGCEMERT